MLITIAITLLLFSAYHLMLIAQNLTTNEKTKKGKLIKFMNLVKNTLNSLVQAKKIDISKIKQTELTNEDIVKFKEIVFKSKTKTFIQ